MMPAVCVCVCVCVCECVRVCVKSILTFVWQMGLCYSLCLLHSLDLFCVCMLCFDLCSSLFGMSTFGLACACVFFPLRLCVCVCVCVCASDCKCALSDYLSISKLSMLIVCAYRCSLKQLWSVRCVSVLTVSLAPRQSCLHSLIWEHGPLNDTIHIE